MLPGISLSSCEDVRSWLGTRGLVGVSSEPSCTQSLPPSVSVRDCAALQWCESTLDRNCARRFYLSCSQAKHVQQNPHPGHECVCCRLALGHTHLGA